MVARRNVRRDGPAPASLPEPPSLAAFQACPSLRVAILDDEPQQALIAAGALTAAGHACVIFSDYAKLLLALEGKAFDLLILGWQGQSGPFGREAAAWARIHLDPPPQILMLTSRPDAEAIVNALDAGADDFLLKPLEAPILLARVHALVRARQRPDTAPSLQRETFGSVVFELAARTVTIGGRQVRLASKEFALALTFFRNLHRALGRPQLMDSVWGRVHHPTARTLDAHVSRLRAKLDLRPASGFRLTSVYSFGYRLDAVAAPLVGETADA